MAAPVAWEGNGAPVVSKTELEVLQMRANSTTNDSLESTRRMVALCDESKEAGIRTLVHLDQQGDQLDRIDEDMDRINADMKEADINLREMEKCCGLCVYPCGKTKGFKEDAGTWRSSGDGVVSGQPTRGVDERKGGAVGSTQYIVRITEDAREDEMEDNMGRVSAMIGNMRNMAVDMEQEIESQIRQCDGIIQMAISNENQIQDANDRAQKLCK
ncbi:unnamed protein product [Oppiella nova]|uniref:Synaptosomal-associated protein n=1 Tax=Oppiella nova TaxID=334625 RepID=A0A7R9M2S4_9ACAR|nr:unnamed protein product [Oppiella nova]CAG2169484.1 unnamed protein product [Oppiella nova]